MAASEPIGGRISRVEPSGKGIGRTVVYEGEVKRHNVRVRLIHWMVGLTFLLALGSGFALFAPWLYKWLSPLFGGGAMARLLHPWFGMAFVIAMLFLLAEWFGVMSWGEADRRWMRRIRDYVTNTEKVEADDVGKFNAGQKQWFWAMVASGGVFLLSGIPLWFPEVFGRTLMWICYFIHDVAALIMLGGFFVHIYESTAGIPGTLRGMVRGTVTQAWAWTHHPGWYRQITGRDAKADRENATRLQK